MELLETRNRAGAFTAAPAVWAPSIG
jgi:hypothetical protein